MRNFSMDVLNRYSSFKPNFKLVSRTVHNDGTVVSNYESPSPVRYRKYHIHKKMTNMHQRAHYSVI